jgi:hypothetical protein
MIINTLTRILWAFLFPHFAAQPAWSKPLSPAKHEQKMCCAAVAMIRLVRGMTAAIRVPLAAR